jgi:hypothetical protein
MSPKDFIGLLTEELRDGKYEISGLDSPSIEAVANKIGGSDLVEQEAPLVAPLDEFLHHRETANAAGSIFQLWPGQNPEEWGDNFIELLNEHCRTVYAIGWDSGGPGAGADVECIEKFLGRYWPRTSMDGLTEPYNSLKEVFEDEDQPFRYVTSATESIWCCEMTTKELLSKLILYNSFDPGFTMEINGKPYKLSEDSRLITARQSERSNNK